MEKVDVVIVGAGIVGLTIGARLAKAGRSLYVIERHDSFGQEISSRNSEVIHAGIYYPSGSLKARLCVEGNKMLYEICSKNAIGHRRVEKLIVATNVKEEEKDLPKLLENGKRNGVLGLKIITKSEVAKIEPNIEARAALYSSSTGIIDTHNLMKYFEYKLKENKGEVTYNCNVVGLRKLPDGYEVTVKDTSGDIFNFHSQIVINSAGLESDSIAQMAGIDTKKQNYCLKYCKGQYFRVTNSRKHALVNRLIYPVPHERASGLGVHATKDLAGGLRLGPDAYYVDRNKFDYEVDISKRKAFCGAALKFLPFLEEEDLIPDTAGMRPKLQGENEDFRDFVIKEENCIGFPGFINLIGIESPGLTGSPAIAEYVEGLIKPILS
ncbi:MAG: NAD(P)/FAD-dependent oxidoreductase [Candidatus Omnitrophica bacterium]|jgi:L-2-hydroxyglutarate oxidase LhgO|nr:NAD(P)/FAD-dependent oxidoreductase [Candidatus Omnitrophota bacterium]